MTKIVSPDLYPLTGMPSSKGSNISYFALLLIYLPGELRLVDLLSTPTISLRRKILTSGSPALFIIRRNLVTTIRGKSEV